MGKRKEGKVKDRGRARRVRKRYLIPAVILAILLVFVTAVWIHATWILPPAPTDWNQKQIAKIDKEKVDFKFAVFGDNHNNFRTFDVLRKELESGKFLFAIQVGDQVIDSESTKFRLYMNQIAGMKTPVVTIVGNHDILPGGHANWEKVFGAPYYSFTVGNCYFIMLDDANEKRIDDEQMRWFEQELAKSRDYEHPFVFMHVPTFRGQKNPDMPMKYFLSDRANAEEIRRLCIAYDVDIVFSGHLHTFDYDIWPSDVHYIVTGGGGAQLWDVEQSRSMHHYIEISITGEGGQLELTELKRAPGDKTYRIVVQPWVYAYSIIVANYFWLAPLLLALVALLTFMAFRQRPAAAVAGSDDSDGEKPPDSDAPQSSSDTDEVLKTAHDATESNLSDG